ncbi:MAG: NAD-dependent succinate-semialdehyde dehydrogenase [Ignavibacteriales bacterium]|nr:NAD-dependent succinate-semialdehyde dehydrogenase [Ignavibacteriales bacterium]MCF8306250.1 NAD-dependent succinate-semialdehyde dehydrogenase [Ignavibacteriales bacterium]MCF8315971.1 NAD-dependent succinate-semialdehyde dehydrogenase [Ignavibacteriales bacterium]MCF8437565.1 NAD-dependent succinate-semialdehyde dehydrogenase [Ignavibacteriales bacterium]
MALISINPADDSTIAEFEGFSRDQVDILISECNFQQNLWKNKNYKERSLYLFRAADVLEKNKVKYARIMTEEMGKPITQAYAEVAKCAWVCRYYAENTEKILEYEIISTDASKSYVRFDPIGVVLAVMPWNFPFWQVFRFAAPALMAGNGALLKHASNVSLSALAIEEVFREAGLPEGLFSTLLIGSGHVKHVLENPLVKAATLTGSEYAGKEVASFSGKHLKKTVMELGGSDPFIILEDADIKEAAKTAATARLINNGQSCIAAKRFIPVKSISEEFLGHFVTAMAGARTGDPMEEATELGPLARADLRMELETQVNESVKSGARILTGGKRIGTEGCFYEATVLSDLKPGMPAYDQEIFGPVASVIIAEDAKDAVRIANDTPFGLGASLWTKDQNKAEKIASEIETGSVFVNGMVKSDPRLPFGGVKLSGYGRELSHYGIKEFVNIKTVWIK